MVGAFLVLAALTVEVNGRVWTVGEGASVSGSVVTVRTDGGVRKSASVTTEVDLSPYLADGAEWRVRVKGRRVAKPAQPWFGVKAMLTYKDGAGKPVYPGPQTKTGDFGWYTIRYRASFGHGVTGHGTFVLGLQETAGEADFDLASFHLGSAKVTRPTVDPAARCAYSAALAARQRLRGVMSPSRPMTEDDFRKLNSWGVTLLRYQMNRFWSGVDMNRNLADYDRWLDGKLDHLAAVVLPMAEKYGIKVLIDLHMPPGGKAWDGEMNLFHEPYYARHFVACWQRIARRFKGHSAVCGYDLLNEPVQSYNAVGSLDYWTLQAEAAKAIRAIDPTTPIYVASCRADSPDAFAELPVLDLKDVVYQTHLYAPMAFTHQGVSKSKPWEPVKWPDEAKGWNREFLRKKLQPVRDFELRHGAKIYVGEFSAVAWAEGADRYLSDCIALFEEYGWDWSYHSYGEFEGWSVEHEAARPYEFKPAESTPRKEVLLCGFQSKGESEVSRPVGRVVQGRPILVDFGPQGEGGYPAAEIASVGGTDVKLRLSYATHLDGAGERGDFWHATRATYLGKDFDLPILPASTDRFDVFPVSGAGTVRAAKCQGLVRYVRVAVDTPGATVDVVRVVLENRGVHSTEPVVGSFECSDPELTRIWQASVRTCQLAAIPSYVATHVTPRVTTLPYLSDGAKRDRLVWSGDLWWAQRNMYAAFAPDSPYLPGSLDMLAENQTPAGYVNACPYPRSRGPITTEEYGPFGSDEFAAWFVPVLADHYLYTGDRALLERRYPNAVRVMDYLASHQDADGLFVQRRETAKHSEGLAVGGTSMHRRTYMHVLLWKAYVDAARMATWMDRPADAARFTASAERLERLLRVRFFRPAIGRFGLSLEQPDARAFVANAAALAFGFFRGDEAKGVLATLDFESHGKFQMMAMRGAFELRDGAKALSLLNGHHWREVVRDTWPGTHLTSECMTLKRGGWGDEAHPDTALAGVFTDYILGVRPTAPGYAAYVIDPIPVPGLAWAKGRVPTPRGFLDVEWKLVDGKPECKASLHEVR